MVDPIDSALLYDEDNCREHLESVMKENNETYGDEYIFITEKAKYGQKPKCKYDFASTAKKLKKETISRFYSLKLYLYHQNCVSNNVPNMSCSGQYSTNINETIIQNTKVRNETIIFLGSTISSFILLVVFIIVIGCLVKKGIICSKKKNSVNENVIVHQNDLYGNLSNQDYFDERYDTNIVEMNENYQHYGENGE